MSQKATVVQNKICDNRSTSHWAWATNDNERRTSKKDVRSSAYGRALSCRWNINSTYTTLLSRGSLMISVPLIVGILWTCLKPDILAIPEVWIADKLFVWFPAPTFENLWSVTRKRLHDKTNNRKVNLWTTRITSWISPGPLLSWQPFMSPNKFVGRHENLFYCKYSLEMKTRCNE